MKNLQYVFTVVPVEKRGALKMRILFHMVHVIEMELSNDGVDNGDEPDLDDGKDIVEEQSDDVAWMCDKYQENVNLSLLW